MNKLKYFTPDEFQCFGACCYDLMSTDLLVKLDIARRIAGVPFHITSSYRDKETNKQAGGKINSAHLRGNAVDISCKRSTDRFHILDGLIAAGFNRIGIGSDFIHADVDEDLVSNVIWTY
tara:strand:+ start:227 stop:586 length:360 start_codon:yes stop_codon:yes gene_type:complete